jgi:hypothetical protein
MQSPWLPEPIALLPKNNISNYYYPLILATTQRSYNGHMAQQYEPFGSHYACGIFRNDFRPLLMHITGRQSKLVLAVCGYVFISSKNKNNGN